METIRIEVRWTDKNYCCGWSLEGFGAVMCTGRSLKDLEREFEESLRFQTESMKEDGEPLPRWLTDGDYRIEYILHPSALLKEAERFTTLSAISKASGINLKQLSHYATSAKNPRPEQMRRIREGLRTIGNEILAFC